jgi:hypothetical protein
MKNFTRLSFIAVIAAALLGAGCNKRDEAGTPAAGGGTAGTTTAPMSSASAASR